MAQAKQSKVNPPPNYDFQFARDDAASTSSAISLRSNIGAEFADDEDHDDHDLPTYSDATGIEEAEVPLLAPEDLDETVDSWTHEDRNGSCNYTRLSPTLTTDPIALKKYLEYEAKIYPTAYIRIRGQHTETRRNGGNNNNKKEVVVDFDFRLDVTDTIARSHGRHRVAEWSSWSIVDHDRKTYRGTRLKAVNKNFRADVEATHSKASLDEWCHLFCASSSLLKSYVHSRLFTECADPM